MPADLPGASPPTASPAARLGERLSLSGNEQLGVFSSRLGLSLPLGAIGLGFQRIAARPRMVETD